MPSTIVIVISSVVGVATLAFAARWWHQKRTLVWRIEDIAASLLRDDEHLKIGQFLNLDQQLRPNESGWTNMKIDIPEHWIVRAVNVHADAVAIALLDGTTYEVHRRNVGPLSYEILDAGRASDAVLEGIWEKYARVRAA